LATISHNRTESDIEEICKRLLNEIMADEAGFFMVQSA